MQWGGPPESCVVKEPEDMHMRLQPREKSSQFHSIRAAGYREQEKIESAVGCHPVFRTDNACNLGGGCKSSIARLEERNAWPGSCDNGRRSSEERGEEWHSLFLSVNLMQRDIGSSQ